jgi:acetyl-CoA C-acetyltransferase
VSGGEQGEPADAVRELLERVVDALGLEASVEVTDDGEVCTGTVHGDDLGLFIGRHGATIDAVAKLRPAFTKDGSVTAGNAASINDAAAAVVLMEAGEAERRGLAPMGRLVAYGFAGVEPRYMGVGPVPAIRQALERAALTVDDLDVIELNEAFAAQAIAVVRDLKLPPEKVNPNGSGISLGHPIGATGCILTVKALHELARTGGRYALVSMCIGGGQGIAAVYERAPAA